MSPKMVWHKAYLAVHLINDGSPQPKFKKAAIYSSPPRSLTLNHLKEVVAEVIFVESPDSYADAKKKLIDLIMTHPGFEWARIWVEETMEAHMARGELLGYVKGSEHYEAYKNQLVQPGSLVEIQVEGSELG